jgi:WD40 repeat protein
MRANENERTSLMQSQDPAQQTLHGMRLRWCLGLNYELSEGVINVSTDRKNEICYSSGHMIVIYDYEKRRQRILQGHSNKISAISYNQKQQILVSADEGDTSMLIVWHFESGCPVRTIFDPEAAGIMALDISNDGNKIITLAKSNNGVQYVRVWKWKDFSRDLPVESEGVFRFDPLHYTNKKDPFRYIKYNQSDLSEFVTTGIEEIRFWRIDKEICSDYNPNSVSKKNASNEQRQELGQTVFLPEEGNSVAVTGTEEGSLIVWDIILIMEEEGNLNNRREVKSINLFGKMGIRNPSVSSLNIYENFLVIGTSAGTVRFYDFRFRIICWFEDLGLARITSISFSNGKKSDNQLGLATGQQGDGLVADKNSQFGEDHLRPRDKSFIAESGLKNNKTSNNAYTLPDEEEDLNFPEFIVCDTEARVHLLNKHLFHQIDVSKRKGKLILQSLDKSVLYMSASPIKAKLCIACSNNKVLEWNLFSSTLNVLKNFKEDGHNNEIPSCLGYSPNGEYLVVGTSQGNVYIKSSTADSFNSVPLLISQKKKGVRCEKLAFAPNSKYFAISDDVKSVSLFKLGHKYDDASQPIEWVFAAKVRVHTARITDICFSSNSTKLFSVAEDMYLAEYNIPKSTDTLAVEVLDKIEAEDIPTACVYYPFENNEDLLLVANAGYKLKLWNVVNEQRVCRMTCLGPTFAGPINFMKILNHTDGLNQNVNSNLNENQKQDLRNHDQSESNTDQVEAFDKTPKNVAIEEIGNSFHNQNDQSSPIKQLEESIGDKNEIKGPALSINHFTGKNESPVRKIPVDNTIQSKENNAGLNSMKSSMVSQSKQNVASSSRNNLMESTLVNKESVMNTADSQKQQNSDGKTYLVFATSEKVIGIIKLPMEGNPNNSIGLVAHSGKINHLEVSSNGNYVFTAGDGDISLNIWQVDYKALQNSPILNMQVQNPLDVYPSLLEGGEQGQLYRDLKDFFYYSQIRRKEENTTKAHKLDGKIPLREIPNLMIALGYYPTLKEIENMQNEIKYSKVHEGILVEELSLKAFVKLFINHRPAYGLTKDYVEEVIVKSFMGKEMSRRDFVDLMTNYGEKMKPEEIEYFLNVLVGEGKLNDLLPERIDSDYITEKILGFETLENTEEA